MAILEILQNVFKENYFLNGEKDRQFIYIYMAISVQTLSSTVFFFFFFFSSFLAVS